MTSAKLVTKPKKSAGAARKAAKKKTPKPVRKSGKWDYNWDHQTRHAKLGRATRHIILFRHGQYNLEGATDSERILTEKGRTQAKYAGQRLLKLRIPIDEFIVSTMTRAQQTGNIILTQLKNKPPKVRSDSMLEEGAPIRPVPHSVHWQPDDAQIREDGNRIEAAFKKYFYRAPSHQLNDSHTVLVCHSNVIRYFMCRALQIPSEAWLRFNLHHASMTRISIYPDGEVYLDLFGDCGFIPETYLSD